MCETVYRFDTEYSADSCEFSPQLHTLATGTYQVNKLDPDSESPRTERLGRIYLHNVNIDKIANKTVNDSESQEPEKQNGDCGSSDNVDTEFCRLVTRLDCPAVLDMKWSRKEPDILGTVHASGELVLLRYQEEVEGEGERNGKEKEGDRERKEDIEEGRLQRLEGRQVCDNLALAMEWNIDSDRIIVSDSDGKLRVIDPNTSLKVLYEYSCHGFEAWTCCFSAWDQNIVFSGGDDCSFNCYDLRVGEVTARKNSRSHTAGVTAMISDRCNDHQIITGSYDEKLRWWDERNLKFETNSLDVGGGVWRIKQRPGGKLLIGAMHGGFCVVQDQHIVARYTEHESLAYGADWLTDEVAATSSFYDHLLTIWSLPS